MKRWRVILLACWLMTLLGPSVAVAQTAVCPTPTSNPSPINIWYGPQQQFGQVGNPQPWINILGNVDVDQVQTLSFTLNGGEAAELVLGPDERRLIAPGDFVVELHREWLSAEENCVELTAVSRAGETTTTSVIVEDQTKSWPLPYEIKWDEVDDLLEVVQPIDGWWVLEEGGVRTHPTQVGYDRVLAVGDESWTDYEVTVSITPHSLDESAFGSPISITPAIGIINRWHGHTNEPVACPHIHCGWEPHGALNWYSFDVNHLQVFTKPPDGVDAVPFPIEFGQTYWFKARVETTAVGHLYRYKAWPDGEAEPADWMLYRMTNKLNLAHGSFLLVAHHVDATFGDLLVEEVATMPRTFILGTVLAWLPILLVGMVGLVLAWRARREKGTAVRLAVAGFVLLLFYAALNIFVDLQLPSLLQSLRWETQRIELVHLTNQFVQAVVLGISLFLLMLAAYRWS
ncbi:MAG: hypothetical protein AAF614_07535 [Chloroflexota bacterium]